MNFNNFGSYCPSSSFKIEESCSKVDLCELKSRGIFILLIKILFCKIEEIFGLLEFFFNFEN